MSFEEAFEALKQLRMDIDPENHLFVGTINPAWLDVIIARLEENLDKTFPRRTDKNDSIGIAFERSLGMREWEDDEV